MKNRFINIFFSVCSVITLFISANDRRTVPIEEHTFLVYRRYYYIARLDRSIRILSHLYSMHEADKSGRGNRNTDIQFVVDKATQEVFRKKYILHSLNRIAYTKSVKSLRLVWDAFKSYRSLSDDVFIEDLSKEIFILARNALEKFGDNTAIQHISSRSLSQMSTSERIDIIDYMCDYIQYMQGQRGNAPAALRTSDLQDIKLSIHTDEVAFRYYLLHRLNEAFTYIDTLPEKNKIPKLYTIKQNEPLFVWEKWGEQKKIDALWQEMKEYRYIDNDAYTRDVILYMYLIVHQEEYRLRSNSNEVTHADVISIYQQVQQMPIEQILDGIDTLVTNVTTVVDHYQESGLTLTGWLKKYWWVPPLALSTIIFKFVSFYYKKNGTSESQNKPWFQKPSKPVFR